MASVSNQILAVLLILFIISPSSVQSNQIRINLSNSIANENLSVYCRSSTHKDLGAKIMSPGTSFTWTGDINVPGENEIWLCLMSTAGDLSGLFAIFISNRDNTRCGQECLWTVRHDGLYLNIPDQGYILQFHWQH